ncbi:unnamed protein product [Adineta steineri]|uniref:G-protein coupled receptors family 1 profile domain-containing protein n=1 Tax=Adineta steineri TaxID=433720 RepID=A0A819R065_9BILA|nr:unnamed protein product [Adineta steineri]CAF4037700.1 unnamed protein product [Adineta steineri]
MNSTYNITCNASIPGATYVDAAPPIPPIYLQGTAAIVYTLLSILTVGGNALVCLTVFHYMGVTTVTNLFIANLAVTDLFIGLLCIPIVLISDYLLSDWPFGIFMCKFTSVAQSVFVVCTVYTLIAMSVDRYVAIIYPLKPKLRRRDCRLLIIILWIFSILFSSPIFFEMHISHICFHRDLNDLKEYTQTVCQTNGLYPSIQTIYNIATLTIIYFIPLSVLSMVYIRLGWQLNKSHAPGEADSERDARIKKSKQKVIKMCFIVVIMFGVCWFPMQLYINILRPYLDQIFDQKYVPHFYFAFHLMAMSNSCINPFIYGVMSSRFRAGYLHYWHCCITCGGLINDHLRQKHHINNGTRLSGTFRRTKRPTCEISVTNNEHIDRDRASSMSAPSMIPLMASHKTSTCS